MKFIQLYLRLPPKNVSQKPQLMKKTRLVNANAHICALASADASPARSNAASGVRGGKPARECSRIAAARSGWRARAIARPDRAVRDEPPDRRRSVRCDSISTHWPCSLLWSWLWRWRECSGRLHRAAPATALCARSSRALIACRFNLPSFPRKRELSGGRADRRRHP
jgi:hypothetical protein